MAVNRRFHCVGFLGQPRWANQCMLDAQICAHMAVVLLYMSPCIGARCMHSTSHPPRMHACHMTWHCPCVHIGSLPPVTGGWFVSRHRGLNMPCMLLADGVWHCFYIDTPGARRGQCRSMQAIICLECVSAPPFCTCGAGQQRRETRPGAGSYMLFQAPSCALQHALVALF